MPSLNIRQLEAFRAVMMTGSVTAAGTSLCITQSSVSKLIAHLEADMGILLFERTKGRLSPRPEATALFLQVNKAFGVLEETTRNARKLSKGTTSCMRVVSFPAFGLQFVPAVLGDFVSARPCVGVSYDIRASSNIEEWVSNRHIDVGFVAKATNRPGVVYESLIELNGVCVVPSKHRLAHQSSVNLEDLVDERFVSLGRETVLREVTDRAFLETGLSYNSVVEAGTSSVACALVGTGVGVAILDPFTALDGWKRGQVSLARVNARVPFKVTALFPQNVPRSDLIQEFMSQLIVQLQRVQQEIDYACVLPVQVGRDKQR
jgi:DNA-binding transcriptional LysR family regulator